MTLTLDGARAALQKVIDPELHRDIVSLGMTKDLEVDGDQVSLEVELTTPACPLKDVIAKDVESALRGAGAAKVNLRFGARVRGAPGTNQSALTPGVKNIVLVGSGKGGVGKSTVTINLAMSLQRMGAKVGVLDADIYGPSLPIMTGTGPRPVMYTEGNRFEPVVAQGLRLMSIGFIVGLNEGLIWRGALVAGTLMQLVRDVNWGELDYLLLDLPPGTGDVPLTLAQNIAAAGAVLVSTPQDVSLADVVRAKNMFDEVGIPVLGIVENMSNFVCPHCGQGTDIFDHGGVRVAAEKMGIRFLGEIPLDRAVREGGDRGVPVVEGLPDSSQAKAFERIARQVAGAVSVQAMKAPRLPVITA